MSLSSEGGSSIFNAIEVAKTQGSFPLVKVLAEKILAFLFSTKKVMGVEGHANLEFKVLSWETQSLSPSQTFNKRSGHE